MHLYHFNGDSLSGGNTRALWMSALLLVVQTLHSASNSTNTRLQWDLNSQWAFKKRAEGCGGSCVTMYYVKALILSFPLISPAPLLLLPSLRFTGLTASQWTWLPFDPLPHNTTCCPCCIFLCAVSTFDTATEWRITTEHSVSGKQWLQEHFYIKHPLPIRRC